MLESEAERIEGSFDNDDYFDDEDGDYYAEEDGEEE